MIIKAKDAYDLANKWKGDNEVILAVERITENLIKPEAEKGLYKVSSTAYNKGLLCRAEEYLVYNLGYRVKTFYKENYTEITIYWDIDSITKHLTHKNT